MATLFPEKQNIYIMGFMGCGKTTIGSLLARKLKRPFKDTDIIIEKKTELSIPQIFAYYGEKEFRTLEKQVISEICTLKNQVIALGGGAVLFSENWDNISATGITVTLSYPPEIILSRLKSDSYRPLLKYSTDKDKLIRIKELMKEREPFYLKADLYLHSDSSFKTQVMVDKIISHLTTKMGLLVNETSKDQT